MDIVEQNIKKAKEKQKLWKTFDYQRKSTKSRNLFSLKSPLKRISCECDKTFSKVASGRYRKVY